MLFDAGNRDADNDLGDFAGDDKTLGACFDKGRIVRHDRGVHDFDPQTRGTVGRAHNVADSAQKLDDPLGKEMVVVFRVVVWAVVMRAVFGGRAHCRPFVGGTLGAMVFAARGLKVERHDKHTKDNEIDGAKNKSDAQCQKIGAGMRPHERDKVEGGHFHEAAREDAHDAKKVHGHGKARRKHGVEQKEAGVGEHKEELERLGNATDYRCNDGGRKNGFEAGSTFGLGGVIECRRDSGQAKELDPAGGGKAGPGSELVEGARAM